MSKAALTSFTRGLSRELGPNGIIVNLLQPGATDRDSNPADGEAADFQRSLTSLGRYAQPREVANAVVFLAKSRRERDYGRHLDRRRQCNRLSQLDIRQQANRLLQAASSTASSRTACAETEPAGRI